MTNKNKPRGTYADYLSGNFEDKIFIFELQKNNGDKTSMFSKETGQPIRFPLSVTIPMVGTIYDKERKSPRKIRFVEGEEHIFVDEQTNDKDFPKTKVFANFINGRKTIDGTDSIALKFFMNWDMNATKEGRDEKKDKMFFLVDTSKLVAVARKADKAKFAAAQWCYDAPLEKVLAVASIKLNSEQMAQQSEDIRWNLKVIAERNPDEFLAMLEDPKTERRFIVRKALDRGIIVLDSRTNGIFWSDNPNQPLSVAVEGKDAVEDFVTKSFSTDGERYYAAILDVVTPKVQVPKVSTPSPVSIPTTSQNNVVEKPVIAGTGVDDSEISMLIEAGLEKGVVVFTKPVWFKYKGENFKSKEALAQALKDNVLMLDLLKKDLL